MAERSLLLLRPAQVFTCFQSSACFRTFAPLKRNLKRSLSPYLSPSPLHSKYNRYLSNRHKIRANSSPDIVRSLELEKKEKGSKPVNAVYWIILVNLGIFVVDHFFRIREIKSLYLYHYHPVWFQFVTSTFCHGSWQHLSSNLFFLYIFGKLVEEEEGGLGLWLSYILTGVGANIVSWLVLPRNAVSVGASGAVFGLFAISVLVKLTMDWRKILEVLILGQFVVDKVMEAAQASAAMNGGLRFGAFGHNVNHIAHLSGALIGALLVWLISKISPPTKEDLSS